MSMTTVTFEIPEAALATIDEIAANMETDRATVLRDALAEYLQSYKQLTAEVEEAERDIDAGNWISQDEMEARFEALVRQAKAA